MIFYWPLTLSLFPLQCIHNSQDLNTAAQHFIERHPFMSEAVAHENNEPLFYEADVIFTHMVVDRINTKQEYTVYFLATGKLLRKLE